MKVLGVRIDGLDEAGALKKIDNFLSGSKPALVFTPNPEMLVKAKKDEYFAKILNNSGLNLCDGFGVQLVVYLKGERVKRLTGVDFMTEFCSHAARQNIEIFLLGSGNELIVEKTKQNLESANPGLRVVGVCKGLEINELANGKLEYNLIENQKIIDQINFSNAKVVFVAFGMGKQEKWLYENILKLTGIKVGVGVGGAFDYISGTIIRAPLLMRKFGLEWAYRLLYQPKRLKRIFNATVKFLFLVLIE